MKKNLIIVLLFFCFIIGCSKKNNALDEVSKYLNSFINLDKDIIKQIDDTIDNDSNICSECKKVYKEILKRQYSTLKYNVISEQYDDNYAVIKVAIDVIDLKKAESQAQNELIPALDEYYDSSGTLNKDLYYKRKYELMLKSNDRAYYEIDFFLEKKNGQWQIKDVTDEDLEKIHGIYKE